MDTKITKDCTKGAKKYTNFDSVSRDVIGCSLEVHRHRGPGLLESVYEQCLAYELTAKRIAFERQIVMPLQYKDISVDCGYRMDFLVEGTVVVELKSIDQVLPVHEAQILTYMRLSGTKVGLLINFNSRLLRDGIKRFVL